MRLTETGESRIRKWPAVQFSAIVVATSFPAAREISPRSDHKSPVRHAVWAAEREKQDLIRIPVRVGDRARAKREGKSR